MEFLEILFGAFMGLSVIASGVLSIVFIYKYPKNRWRFLPGISFIALVIIGALQGEAPLQDQLQQRLCSFLLLIWSSLMMGIVMIPLKSEKGVVCASLRIVFGITSIIFFAGSVFSLINAWAFEHSF
jgi:hypothetical protein